MYEHVNLARDVAAIQIPDGTRLLLAEGTRVIITQELGGSFTVMTERGAMYRIDDKDGDALGKALPEKPEVDAPVDPDALEDQVWSQMKKCYDPEIPVNVVDLGLIYDCKLESSEDGGRRVDIKMTLTAPGCGMGPVLAEDVRSRVQGLNGIDEVKVEVVFDPPWNPNMMTEVARLQLGFM